jgi:hypothetical protein
MLRFHHIGVQTDDLKNCLHWYLDCFEEDQAWHLDRFSDLTTSRLPGIRELTEVPVGTEIVTDADGDVNGLEFEFTRTPNSSHA